MTEKNGLYYCDICSDIDPIPRGTGFSFPPNPLNILHSHQTCYFNKQREAKEVLQTESGKEELNKLGVDITDNEKTSLVEENVKYAKKMIEDYRRQTKNE